METTTKPELMISVFKLGELIKDYEGFDEENYKSLQECKQKKRNQHTLFVEGVMIEFYMNPYHLNPERIVDGISVRGQKGYHEFTKDNPIWETVAKKIAERNCVVFDRLNEAYFVQKKWHLEEGDDIRVEINRVGNAQQELEDRIEREVNRILQ